MKRLITLLLSISPALSVYGQGKERYTASTIDPQLLLNANAVLRLYENEVTVKSLNEVVEREHYIITILNKDGNGYAGFAESFSKLNKIDKVYACIYDKNGTQKMKVKQSEFDISNSTLAAGYYDDEKILSYQCSYLEYPYTVEYFKTATQNHTFTLPTWVIRPGHDCAVEQSSFKMKTPLDFEIRKYCFNTTVQPDTSLEDDHRIYSWTASNLSAERKEPLSGEVFDGTPIMRLSPVKFMLGKDEGNMSNWKSYGSFISHLNKDRDELSEERKQKIRQMIEHLPDARSQVETIYKYMQDNTRYVSIQYGIGGWQTIDAKTVSENQYGDCKGLSNYMMAMLKEAGIQSFPVLVYAGKDTRIEMPPDFPSNSFNHMILCVPIPQDTIWLECTSPDLPAGYLGSFTDNRDALMITAEGGVVAHTPVYDERHNIIRHYVKATYGEDGNLLCKLRNHYEGIPAEPLTRLNYLNNAQKDNYIHSKFGLPSYTANGYNISRNQLKNTISFDEYVEISANNMVKKAGSYRMLNVDLVPVTLPFEVMAEERKKSFKVGTSYSVTDTFEVVIPDLMEITQLPQPVAINSAFGSFEARVVNNGNILLATRRLIVKQGLYNPQQYTAYEKWVSAVNSTSSYKVMMKSK